MLGSSLKHVRHLSFPCFLSLALRLPLSLCITCLISHKQQSFTPLFPELGVVPLILLWRPNYGDCLIVILCRVPSLCVCVCVCVCMRACLWVGVC